MKDASQPNRKNPRWALSAAATTSTDPLSFDVDGNREDNLRRHLDLSVHLRTPLPRLAAARPSTATLHTSFRKGSSKRPPPLQRDLIRSAQMHRASSLPRLDPGPMRPDLLATRANHSDLANSDRDSIDHIFGRGGHDDQRVQLGAARRGRSPDIHIRNHRHVHFRPSTPRTKSLPPTPEPTPPFEPRPDQDGASVYSELSYEFAQPVDEDELTSFLLTPSPLLPPPADSIASIISSKADSSRSTPVVRSPVSGRSGASPNQPFLSLSPNSLRGPASDTPIVDASPAPTHPAGSVDHSDESYLLQAPENSIDGHSPAITARSTLTAGSSLTELPMLSDFPSPPIGSWPSSARTSHEYERLPTSTMMLRTISV